jgi:signal transduction histidine kinase
MLKGDPGIFKQILMNIFANSRDAISERLKNGKMSRGSIRISVRVEDGALVADIADNGGGIAAGALDRVFEPYFTTKEDKKGTGIGLYMSKIFIEEHMQGSITAGNTGDGAVVTLVFSL